MALVLPYPSKPANGDTLDATVVQANFTAIAQAIQSFDGSQIQAASVQPAALAVSANPIQRALETFFDFIYSGLTIGNPSGLNITIAGGVMYIIGNRAVFAGVGSFTVGASKDTYIDVDYLGNVVYQAVSNNAASPSITANSIRIGIVISGASTISFINQGQLDSSLANFAPLISSVALTHTDTLGNIIYPTDPSRKLLGYRQNIVGGTTTSGTVVQQTGLTAPVIVPLNRKVKVTNYSSQFFNNTATARSDLQVFDGTIGGGGVALSTAYGVGNNGFSAGQSEAKRIYNPSVGLHTYNGGFFVENGGTANFQAAAINPAYLSIELE